MDSPVSSVLCSLCRGACVHWVSQPVSALAPGVRGCEAGLQCFAKSINPRHYLRTHLRLSILETLLGSHRDLVHHSPLDLDSSGGGRSDVIWPVSGFCTDVQWAGWQLQLGAVEREGMGLLLGLPWLLREGTSGDQEQPRPCAVSGRTAARESVASKALQQQHPGVSMAKCMDQMGSSRLPCLGQDHTQA